MKLLSTIIGLLLIGLIFPINAFADQKNISYVVRKNDCLYKIASAYKIKVSLLYSANKKIVGSNPDLIYPGQRLLIPVEDLSGKEVGQPMLASAVDTNDNSEPIAGSFAAAMNRLQEQEIMELSGPISPAPHLFIGNNETSFHHLTKHHRPPTSEPAAGASGKREEAGWLP